MSEPTRYDQQWDEAADGTMCTGGEIEPDPSGKYVLWVDYATLAATLREVEAKCDRWHQIVKDQCEMEEDARIAAGESDTSDSHGVEPLADIIKNLKAQLAHAQANAAALREFVKDFAAIKPKDTDLSYFAYLWEQFLPRAQAILTSPSPGAAMVEELEQLRKAPLAAVNTDDVNWAITELHKKLEQRYDTLAAAAREALLVWHSVSLEAEHCAFDRLKAALEGGGTDGDADRLNKRDLEVNAERNRLTTKSKSVQE